MNFENEIISIGNEQLILSVHPFGARIVSLLFKSKDGALIELVEGYEEYEPYLKKRKYSGAIVGPFAGRISKGNFKVQTESYQLEQNEGKHSLHSGNKNGLHNVKWKLLFEDEKNICFTATRSLKEDGFPGNRKFEVNYNLEGGTLKINFAAETDKDTHVNLSSHGYFVLDDSGNLDSHEFKINADQITELDKDKLPTGKLSLVAKSDLDLRKLKKINPSNHDHNYVLNPKAEFAAEVVSIQSGISLKVRTSKPGLQFYTGDQKYFCLETQHFPDTPNQPSFPSTLVKAGEKYTESSEYIFGQK